MNLRQSADERVAQFGGALNAALAGSAGLVGVEVRAQDGVGELGACAAIIHVSLRSLNLEFVQDTSQLGDLFLVQVKFVRKKAQRAAHAPTAADSRRSFGWVAAVVAVARHRTSSPITGLAMSVGIRLIVVKAGMTSEVAHGAPGKVAHDFLLLAEAFRSRRGLMAWALCLTLIRILCGSTAL